MEVDLADSLRVDRVNLVVVLVVRVVAVDQLLEGVSHAARRAVVATHFDIFLCGFVVEHVLICLVFEDGQVPPGD